jgi:hypothetical protein
MKPLEKPPEWEGDDSINDPPDLKKVTQAGLSDVPDHGDQEDDDDDE